MMIRSVSAGNICLSKSCVNVPNALPRNRMVSSYLSDYVLHTKRSFLQKYKIGAIKYYPIRLKTSITKEYGNFSNYIDFKETYFLFLQQVYKKSWKTICSHALINDDNHLINNALYYECIIFMLS